jgi:hypothetical protein
MYTVQVFDIGFIKRSAQHENIHGAGEEIFGRRRCVVA